MILYVYTSPHSNMIGYYYLPIEYMVADLKWTPVRVKKAFREGLDKGFYEYDFEASIIMVQKWFEYNGNFNTNQIKKAVGELSEIPDNQLVQQFKSLVKGFSEPLWESFEKGKPNLSLCSVTGTVTKPVTVTEDPIPYSEIIEDLNKKADKKYRDKTESYRKAIRGRWEEGRRLADFQYVHSVKCAEWLGTDMEKYLSPDTLYRASKFDKYLNQKETVKKDLGEELDAINKRVYGNI